MDGLIIADTPREARDSLRAQGLIVQRLAEQQSASQRRWRLRGGRAAPARVVGFIRELSTLLAVGAPLLEAIAAIQKQHRGGFASCLLALRERVAGGATLADAMREHPAYFDDLTTHITEVGENSGALESSLERIAEFQDRALAFKGRLGTVLLYPAIVFVMAIGVSILLMTVVVPNLLSAIAESGQPLPLPTRLVKGASDFLVGWWWLILLLIVSAAAAFRAAIATARGGLLWQRLLLKIPLLGDLIRKQAIVRICIILSTLLRSGMVFVQAMQTTRGATSNRVLARAMAECEAAISAGLDIAAALEKSGAFPPVVVQVFAVGQQSGRLEEMLDRLASDYDRQVQTAAARLTALLEPLLILGLVAMVGLIGVATILPLLEAADVT